MKNVKKVAAWIYGVQVVLVLPWFIGAIYRREQSVWAMREYDRHLARHGQGDALFAFYLYAVFYSSLFVIPYAVLGFRYRHIEQSQPHRAVIASWFAASYIILEAPIGAFVRSLPSGVWNGWLLILWAGATVFAIVVWTNLRGSARSQTGQDSLSGRGDR